MRAAIYARVSTTDKGQDPAMQLHDLTAYAETRQWTIAGQYIDEASGGKGDRKAFKELMADAKQRKFDVVLVWKLNRFSRSMIHLINSVNELEALGVQFVSLKDGIDFTTPAGRLQFHLLAALAEFERETIRENVRAGIENARRKGKRIGRKGLAPIDRKKIIEAYEQDPALSLRAIARAARATLTSTARTLKDYKAGLLDVDGFSYSMPLVDAVPKPPSKAEEERAVNPPLLQVQ
ncbi:MAG: recombinase family protein [Dissulfurispiraceae bacterium]